MNIGTTVKAWNYGCEGVTGKFVGMTADGYYQVEWTRTSGFAPKTYIGTFNKAEVA